MNAATLAAIKLRIHAALVSTRDLWCIAVAADGAITVSPAPNRVRNGNVSDYDRARLTAVFGVPTTCRGLTMTASEAEAIVTAAESRAAA